jgi:hypothetical protein
MPVCLRFTDDFGNEIFPYQLPYNTYMNRYYFYYGYY